MLYIVALLTLISMATMQDPVDKLFEFQQLMKSKTKIPSRNQLLILEQQVSDYDSSDIFSEGYITVDEYDEYAVYEEEPIDEDDEMEILMLQKQQEKERLEQERALEQQRVEEQQREQQRLEQQRLEQKRLEQLESLRQQELEQKKKQLIEIPDQWTDDIEEEPIKPKKQKKQRKPVLEQEDEEQILEVLNQAKKTKVQSLEGLEEMEKKIVKKRRKREQEQEQDEFVQKVPAQNQTFIHFNNKNNNLELAPCSNNPIQQRACSLCKSEVGYQLDDDNWYMIGLQHGYKKEFLLLIEITKQSFGESQLYLSFSSNGSACMTSDTLKHEIDVESVLQRFSGRSWRHFIKNEQFALPQSLEGRSFQFKAVYQNKQFVFSDFEVKFAANLANELKSANSEVVIKTTAVEFITEQLQCTLSGQIKQQNDELPFVLRLKNGEATSELAIPNCQIPIHNELLYGVSDMYFGEYFKEALQQKLKGNFRADLNATTSFENGKLKVRFAMKKLNK